MWRWGTYASKCLWRHEFTLFSNLLLDFIFSKYSSKNTDHWLLDLLTALLVLNVDSYLKCLHLHMLLRTVQHSHSALICVLHDWSSFINLVVVVVVVVLVAVGNSAGAYVSRLSLWSYSCCSSQHVCVVISQTVYFCRTSSNMRDCVARLRRGSIVTSRSYITDVCCVSCSLIDRLVEVDVCSVCVHAVLF